MPAKIFIPKLPEGPEPPPFNVDSWLNTSLSEEPMDQSFDKRRGFVGAMEPFVRPFAAQGYNAVAALNRGTAALWSHLDSIADYIEVSSGLDKGGLFEKMATIASENADYWAKRAEDVGIGFVDEIVSEAVGGFVPGVTQFALDVGSGFTFPYMAGAAEAYERGESPFEVGMIEAARTATLDVLFKMMHPLKQYLRAPSFGTVFGLQEAEQAPEGGKTKAFFKGAAIGAMYSVASPGGRLGLNEVKQTTKQALENINKLPASEFLQKKFAEERGSFKTIRIEETGKIDFNKPQGLYLEKTEKKGELTSDIQGVEISFDVNPKKPLNVPKELMIRHERGSGFSIPASSGIKALKELVGNTEFNRLMKLNKKEAIEEVSQKYPDVKWTRYFDAYEILEGYAGKLAKEKGYDSIIGDTHEIVVFDKNIIKELKPKQQIEFDEFITGEKRQRKFLKTIEEAKDIDPTVKEKTAELKPQDYFVEPNVESFGKARERIDKEGQDKVLDYLRSEAPPSAEKGALFHEMIKDSQRVKDYDRTIELIELYDKQGREAGRFIQTASTWTKLLSPEGFIRWANKQLASVQSKYGWQDTIIGRKPKSFELNKEEQKLIFEKYREIEKIQDPLERSDATMELIDIVAKKVPPSVTELIDAYRYQNMLSSPRTQMRNIGENALNTFITRPVDIVSLGAIDFTKSALTGKARENYISDAPLYLKSAINSIPNAVNAFSEAIKLSRSQTIEKPELGIEARTEFERARAKQIPTSLTYVQRFMEAADKFNMALIGAGEMSRLIRKGVPETEAHSKATELAQKYLYRERLEPGDPSLSAFSTALNSLGKMVEFSRKTPGLKTVSKWYVPFLRTPINKSIQMIEHSPLGAVRRPSTFSPEVNAKILSGSVAMGLGALYATLGETTWAPPTNKEEKSFYYASGRKPFSIKIGDEWVPLWYMGPFALAFGLPAAAKYYMQDENKALAKGGSEKLFDLAQGTAQFLGSQTSTQSIGGLFSALHGDIDFTFSSQTGFTIQQVIPANGLVRYVNTILDPVYRKPKGFVERIEASLPVLSKNLDAHMTPYFEEARRRPVNYFLPYDIGKDDPRFGAQLPMIRYEQRAKAIERKMNKIIKQVEEGRIDHEKAMEQMMKLSTEAPAQSLIQLGKELQ